MKVTTEAKEEKAVETLMEGNAERPEFKREPTRRVEVIIGLKEDKFIEFQKIADIHTEAAKLGVLDYKNAYGQIVNFLMENLFKKEVN